MVHSQVLQLDTEQEAYTRRRRVPLDGIAAYVGTSWYVEQALSNSHITPPFSVADLVRELLVVTLSVLRTNLDGKHVSGNSSCR